MMQLLLRNRECGRGDSNPRSSLTLPSARQHLRLLISSVPYFLYSQLVMQNDSIMEASSK